MYIINGIVYAGEKSPAIKVSGVRVLKNDGYKLWLHFNTGEEKIFDFSPLLDKPAFVPLKDKELFESVYLDYGFVLWGDGSIDIAPEYLYQNSTPAIQKCGKFATLKMEEA